MNWLRQHGLRWRLAILYMGIFASGLLIFCALLFQYFQRTQIQAFDTSLYNFTVDVSANLEMDFVGRLFVLNSNMSEAGKVFPFHLGGSFLEIRDSSGKVLLHSRSLSNRGLPFDQKLLRRLANEKAIFQTVSAAALGLKSTAPELRLLTFWANHEGWREPLILQVAVPLDLPLQERRDLLVFFALSLPFFILIAGLAGVWMSKSALQPVREITLKAREINGVENLKERLPVGEARDEIRELSQTFNSMLDRLEQAFASQDRFVSNASHQLKTPLTILKGELELLQKRPLESAEVREGLQSASTEIDRLITLVQDLLLLARLDAGHDNLSLVPVRLDEVLMRVVSRVQKIAKNKNVKLVTHFRSENGGSELEVEVLGDEELLDSMIENFLENAVKYAPENSLVELDLNSCAETVELKIRDRGPGVPVELRQKIFERFQRVQPSNQVPGSGLGLAIAAEIARIHEVDIALEAAGASAAGAAESEAGTGMQVQLRFPRASV